MGTVFQSTMRAKLEELDAGAQDLAPSRLRLLNDLVQAIVEQRASHRVVKLNFICTHNSRRSQMAQVWATAAAAYFRVGAVQSFSGGTETTAFNPRAVAALRRAGFSVEPQPDDQYGHNVRYAVRYSKDVPPIICFSKLFDDPQNPRSEFCAVMTCGEADENCPVILGARRVPLLYDDPKSADGTKQEARTYDERSDQIGRELLWVFRKVSQA